ncbi:MAG: metallopeptidase TldD-related protein, partial [Thermoanaerobaculia bacterium]|nr:metallopeptidase TldD-related protein [Thermoanaerobaculia bacterium]
LDTRGIARALAPVAEREGDRVDALFERIDVLGLPPDGGPPGIEVRREEGLSVRLWRDGKSWTSSRDRLEPGELEEAIRQVSRTRTGASMPVPPIRLSSTEISSADRHAVLRFPGRLQKALRDRRVAFPYRLTVQFRRRDLRVVADRVGSPPQTERFFGCDVETPWGRCGSLTPSLGSGAAEELADRLVARFRCREASAPEPGSRPLVLGPQTVAVLLHEAVAHALEADTLALTGPPEGALGVELGPSCLSVLDDPGAAGEGLSRSSDDEGSPTARRWLLREGVVEQVLADRSWASRSDRLEPGAGRRSSRHERVGPRSRFLELLPGEGALEDLLQEVGDGLYLPEADRGRLDPWTGRFVLRVPGGRRVREGRLGDPVGPCLLVGPVANLLSSVLRVGGRAVATGAGWCAKGGQRLPVFASCPPLSLREGEIGA